ncbi:uncharacterized protein [Panulirus ornatus]|uniref:uncharacterized protein n=1 Tax=Panulirus ornatus TaxID=150431 RepID=UPI003A897EEF
MTQFTSRHIRDVNPLGHRKQWLPCDRDPQQQNPVPLKRVGEKLRTRDTEGGERSEGGKCEVIVADVGGDPGGVSPDEISCCSGSSPAASLGGDTRPIETESGNGVDVLTESDGGCARITNGEEDIAGDTMRYGGSVDRIGDPDGRFGDLGGKPDMADWKIGGSDDKIGYAKRKIGDREIGGSEGRIGGSDDKIQCQNKRKGGSLPSFEDRDVDIENCEWKTGGRDGETKCIHPDLDGKSVWSREPNEGDTPGDDYESRASEGDLSGPARSVGRSKPPDIKFEEVIEKTITHNPASVRKLNRASSSPTPNRTKSSPADGSKMRRIIARLFLPKSGSVISFFSSFLASYTFRPSRRRASDPTPMSTETNDEEKTWEKDEERMTLEEAASEVHAGWRERSSAETHALHEETTEPDGDARLDDNEEAEEGPGDEDKADEDRTSETDKENSDSKEEECDINVGDDNDVFFDPEEGKCEEDLEECEGNSWDSDLYDCQDGLQQGQGWVRKRVSQIERQISIRQEQQHLKELKRQLTGRAAAFASHISDGAAETERPAECDGDKGATYGLRQDMEESDATTRAESSAEDSDTEVEEDEVQGTVTLRSKSRERSTSMYRYSTRPTSLFRYSVVRPRTVIIGLGVCTETQFFSESFGDGVSETESEDEEEDGAPTTPHTTPTTPRAPSPSRTSRPHSPLSDMDTESKRNSQAVSTEPSDLEDHSSVTTSDLDSCHDLAALDARKDKAYRIAHELLHTERTYVKVLHLIDQEFQFRVDHENRAHHMFPHDVIPHMFSNVKSIYKLHHDFLLPQLEERMAQWERNRRIGDIMKSFAPFLKMYTEYVRNFDNAMTLINQWQSKCPRFAAIMDEIHSMEVCGNLTLQHHMLSPVQRIPRYEMLIRDYLKKLPEDSPDRHDTEQALHLVSTAANHANDAMKKIDKFEKLLEIQESLGGAEDLVSPTRELIKEGKIIKISARSGDHQERYIFLLTDLLLLCSPRRMGGRVMSGPQYRLRAKYHVENLIVQEGDNLETANTFYIKDNNKSVELYTQTLEEKEQWLEAFIRAIHETSQRKSSLKLHFNPDQRIVDVDLGQKQPMLIRSDSVTKCMECGSQFTMVRRKHHCRACGAVVCSKCSSFKASLAYESGKSVRVCRTCHTTLQELSSSTATPSPEIDDGDECSLYNAKEPPDLPFRNRGVLEVSAKTGGAVMQGFLQLKTHRKTWVKRWFALHTDFVLYSFKCEADEQALTATPVPGFTVTHLQGTRNESGISDKEKERAFKLHHSKKHYIFQAASKEESHRWVAALKKASQAELPSPVQ